MKWIVAHRPVNIEGTVIFPRREAESVVPDELVDKMDSASRAACVKLADDRFALAFPAAAPAAPAKAVVAVAPEAK